MRQLVQCSLLQPLLNATTKLLHSLWVGMANEGMAPVTGAKRKRGAVGREKPDPPDTPSSLASTKARSQHDSGKALCGSPPPSNSFTTASILSDKALSKLVQTYAKSMALLRPGSSFANWPWRLPNIMMADKPLPEAVIDMFPNGADEIIMVCIVS